MTMRLVRMALGGLVLSCSACVVAPPPGQVAMQQMCRQFTQTIAVDGKDVPGYGVECLQADGSWKVVAPATTTTPQQAPVVTVPAPGYVYEVPYYAYPYYVYPDAYPWVYPWYYGPDIDIGIGGGWGRGWGGGWGRGGGGWGRGGGGFGHGGRGGR